MFAGAYLHKCYLIPALNVTVTGDLFDERLHQASTLPSPPALKSQLMPAAKAQPSLPAVKAQASRPPVKAQASMPTVQTPASRPTVRAPASRPQDTQDKMQVMPAVKARMLAWCNQFTHWRPSFTRTTSILLILLSFLLISWLLVLIKVRWDAKSQLQSHREAQGLRLFLGGIEERDKV
jgi:hypothetical protein